MVIKNLHSEIKITKNPVVPETRSDNSGTGHPCLIRYLMPFSGSGTHEITSNLDNTRGLGVLHRE